MTGARKYNNERETAKKGLYKNLLVQNILTVFFINIKSFTIDFKQLSNSHLNRTLLYIAD